MKWDNVVEAPCLITPPCDVNAGVNDPGTGTDGNGTTPDPRCSDPEFAAMHPELCSALPIQRLIVKPDNLTLCNLQGAQFQAFIVINESEIELTGGVEWSTSDANVALVGIASGNVTGVTEGIASISATYQGLTGYGQVTVLPGCCDEQVVGTVLLIDNSASMAAQFGSPYATRLSYAKHIARRYAGELNITKDTLGLNYFAASAVQVLPLGDDIPVIQTAIDGIVQTMGGTNLNDALVDAISYLNSQPVDRRVVVLFSDGENKDGPDPGMAAAQFKGQGGVIVVVGIRAHDGGYNLLQRIASGGFFLNALPSNSTEVSNLLSGLKGYFCAGNCTPEDGMVASQPALNFFDFLNWDVLEGTVDLIGTGNTGIRRFDIIPGHGLYVDLAGSGSPFLGKLATKQAFDFVPGTTYRLSYKLAGNNRQALIPFPYTVRITVENAFTVDRGLNNAFQDFVLYEDEFTVPAPVSGRIIIQQLEQASGFAPFGNLLDDVRLEAVDEGVMFLDSFDTENASFIQPKCGTVPEVPYSGTCDDFNDGTAPFCIAAYHDDFFDLAEAECVCSESNEPAWNGCFVTGPAGRLEPCNFWTSYYPAQVHTVIGQDGRRVLMAAAIVYNLNADTWDMAVFCSNGETLWHGEKAGGTNPAGTYNRLDGCSQVASLVLTQAASSGNQGSYGAYSCYGYGCLSEPVPAQQPDPNPLVDLESS